MIDPEVQQVHDYLGERASAYGGSVADILDKTPTILWDNPDELMAFWEDKDLSHLFPQSLYPQHIEDWNSIVPEDADINRARGAVVMSAEEIELAYLDNQVDALNIDMINPNDSSEYAEQLIELAFA